MAWRVARRKTRRRCRCRPRGARRGSGTASRARCARGYSRGSRRSCSKREKKGNTTKHRTLNFRPPVYKPGSVGHRMLTPPKSGRSFLSGCGRPHPLAAYPRRLVRGGPPLAAYLALLRLWFTLPPALPRVRWRSYPTFSPLPDPSIARGPSAVCFLWHCQSRESCCHASSCPGVTWQPALWSPDFPRSVDRNLSRPPCRDRPTGGVWGKYKRWTLDVGRWRTNLKASYDAQPLVVEVSFQRLTSNV